MAAKKRGRPSAIFQRADHALLVEHDLHPIEEMIKEAKKAKGMDKVLICDRVAKYFYPPLKAHEHNVAMNGTIKITLGGNEPGK